MKLTNDDIRVHDGAPKEYWIGPVAYVRADLAESDRKERDMAIQHLQELVSDSRHVHEGTNALADAREFLKFIEGK